MNIQDTANTKSAYAIGQPVKRKEDSKLLRGQGRYTDDIDLPNQAYAYVLRSTVAHGRIKSINTETAKPCRAYVYTGADMHPTALAVGAAVHSRTAPT
jgi:carbon-monoxide dehydrogenase large subunit